jgi:hypothetical protein
MTMEEQIKRACTERFVTVYADANYQGASQRFGPGSYDVHDLNVVGNTWWETTVSAPSSSLTT